MKILDKTIIDIYQFSSYWELLKYDDWLQKEIKKKAQSI